MIVLNFDNLRSMEFDEKRIEFGRNQNISNDIEINRGEGSAEILFKNRKTVSRRHCKILERNSQWYLQDLESTNGTYLNGRKLPKGGEHPIGDGDIVSLGSSISIDIKLDLDIDVTIFEDGQFEEELWDDMSEKTQVIETINRDSAYFPLSPLTPLHGGKYKVIEQLGTLGNFAIAYLAEDLKSNSKVLIREYFPKGSAVRKIGMDEVIPKGSQANFQLDYGSFKRGVEAVMGLSKHQNIVGIDSFFEENGTAYYVINYLEGESLNEYLEKNHPLTQGGIENIIFPLFDAVKHLHKQGILHGDINLSNILITKDLKPKLLDFGIVQGWFVERSRTVGFAPIEHYMGGVEGRYSDIYSLGMVTYALINGITEPHKLPTASARLEGASLLKFPIKSKRISKKFMEALKKSLEIEPEDRPQDIDELTQLFKQSSKKSHLYFTIGVVLTLLLGLIIIFKTFQSFL